MLSADDVLPGVPDIVREVKVEAFPAEWSAIMISSAFMTRRCRSDGFWPVIMRIIIAAWLSPACGPSYGLPR